MDFCTFLLPASDYTIDDVWDTVGLRGTGSHDFTVAEVFVPTSRSLTEKLPVIAARSADGVTGRDSPPLAPPPEVPFAMFFPPVNASLISLKRAASARA